MSTMNPSTKEVGDAIIRDDDAWFRMLFSNPDVIASRKIARVGTETYNTISGVELAGIYGSIRVLKWFAEADVGIITALNASKYNVLRILIDNKKDPYTIEWMLKQGVKPYDGFARGLESNISQIEWWEMMQRLVVASVDFGDDVQYILLKSCTIASNIIKTIAKVQRKK
jgi:hypothetical protein